VAAGGDDAAAYSNRTHTRWYPAVGIRLAVSDTTLGTVLTLAEVVHRHRSPSEAAEASSNLHIHPVGVM